MISPAIHRHCPLGRARLALLTKGFLELCAGHCERTSVAVDCVIGTGRECSKDMIMICKSHDEHHNPPYYSSTLELRDSTVTVI